MPSAGGAGRDGDPGRVVAEADGHAERVAHRGHRAQVHDGGRGRVERGAAQQRDLVAAALRRGGERLLDLAVGGHAGGEDQRDPGRGGVADEAEVDELERGDLQRGDAELGQLVDGGAVEGEENQWIPRATA